MTVFVAGHAEPRPDSAAWVARLTENLIKDLDALSSSPRRLRSAWKDGTFNVNARFGVDQQGAELGTWEAVVDAAQLGCALFRTAGMTEGTTEVRIHHEMRTLPAAGPSWDASAEDWIQAFWYAIITRDQPKMTELCELPIDVLRASGADHDDYLYHWVATLQAYWLKRPELVPELTLTFQRSHPDVAVIAGRDYIQQVAYPPINLFYKFLQKDEEGFHTTLLESLELHKQYWTATPERADDIDGLVPIGILAVTCLAYDGGIPVNVESPYLPEHLLKRSWVGEFEV
ncbi:immunity 49 family protein [Streptomyces katrae]|uniref:Immunity 49 family protein n=1 Tax=Streptomyces katrae TaxID=68223 RepID=A0ABT7GX11_9ACTN|nr:immunity 49 family protein [Streptomyces katrae]MDK9497789.1 immunity 49 family protein [Streptomyces katrae]